MIHILVWPMYSHVKLELELIYQYTPRCSTTNRPRIGLHYIGLTGS
jgi:hypothetical protein